MPKKFVGENAKSAAARERKTETKNAEQAKKQKAADDAFWADDDKQVARKQQRKEEDERKRLEAAKRKEENRTAYEEDMAKAGTKTTQVKQAPQKVTRAQLAARAEAMMRAVEEQERQRNMKSNKIEEVDHLSENINRIDLDVTSARNVEEAIQVLGDVEEDPDKNPEKRMRAAFTAFEEVRLPQLKKENPSLKLSQLKQLLWKEWKKSPQNPLNQTA